MIPIKFRINNTFNRQEKTNRPARKNASRKVCANPCPELEFYYLKTAAKRKISSSGGIRFNTRRNHSIFAPALSEKDFKSIDSG